jgi:hypothetical protein
MLQGSPSNTGGGTTFICYIEGSGMTVLLCALFLGKHGAGEAANAVEEKIAMEVRPCLSD